MMAMAVRIDLHLLYRSVQLQTACMTHQLREGIPTCCPCVGGAIAGDDGYGYGGDEGFGAYGSGGGGGGMGGGMGMGVGMGMGAGMAAGGGGMQVCA
jgi:hypothetical protein